MIICSKTNLRQAGFFILKTIVFVVIDTISLPQWQTYGINI